MKLFLDTEFNGFGGKLISMALVPEYTERTEFYCEIEMKDQLDPWVKENVVPHLFQSAYPYSAFQIALAHYLNYSISAYTNDPITIIADWPDDIRYFCEALITGPGQRIMLINPKINFELNLNIKYESLVAHNALHDARGIRFSYMNNYINR